jgi:hypothetical protein
MKRLALVLIAFPIVAVAQVPQPTPSDEAMQQRIIQLTGESLNWQIRALTAERQVSDLQKQLDAAKAPPSK